MEIVIDGYNLILSGGLAKKALKKSIREAKNLMVSILSRYSLVSGHKIILVLDGGKNASLYTVRKTDGPLEIIHTAKNMTADRWIIDNACREGFDGIIVSSDREILKNAEEQGVKTLTVGQFEKKL